MDERLADEAGDITLVVMLVFGLFFAIAELIQRCRRRRRPEDTEVVLKVKLVKTGIVMLVAATLVDVGKVTGTEKNERAAVITDVAIANAQGDFGEVIRIDGDTAEAPKTFQFKGHAVDAFGEIHVVGYDPADPDKTVREGFETYQVGPADGDGGEAFDTVLRFSLQPVTT